MPQRAQISGADCNLTDMKFVRTIGGLPRGSNPRVGANFRGYTKTGDQKGTNRPLWERKPAPAWELGVDAYLANHPGRFSLAPPSDRASRRSLSLGQRTATHGLLQRFPNMSDIFLSRMASVDVNCEPSLPVPFHQLSSFADLAIVGYSNSVDEPATDLPTETHCNL